MMGFNIKATSITKMLLCDIESHSFPQVFYSIAFFVVMSQQRCRNLDVKLLCDTNEPLRNTNDIAFSMPQYLVSHLQALRTLRCRIIASNYPH